MGPPGLTLNGQAPQPGMMQSFRDWIMAHAMGGGGNPAAPYAAPPGVGAANAMPSPSPASTATSPPAAPQGPPGYLNNTDAWQRPNFGGGGWTPPRSPYLDAGAMPWANPGPANPNAPGYIGNTSAIPPSGDPRAYDAAVNAMTGNFGPAGTRAHAAATMANAPPGQPSATPRPAARGPGAPNLGYYRGYHPTTGIARGPGTPWS